MDKKKLEEFTKKLLEEKSKIEIGLQDFEKEFREPIESLEEAADEAEEFFNFESVYGSQKERLAKIDKALWKLEKGIFGVCEKCGREIEDEVLDVNPESELCKECKAKLK